MVLSRHSNCRRRIDSSLEQRVYSRSSTDTSGSDGNTKGTDGESSSDNTPAKLKGPELGHPASNEQLLQLGIELQYQDSSGGSMDEEYGSLPSYREDESYPTEFIKEKGEAWWFHMLYERGVSIELAKECKAWITMTT
ncbi:uncharacterized protein MONOS_14275 [Monocercomonoides exilis]|uniref:uncharacterized protein n=1 Tax=Monocercomonoides exilis TaxID=2049356 RepID=UPI00355A52AC|nr:hypothetical protein MONOS_14275 [Monocercomonoides exilis]|eukprot:MONOS_14275.1-p1 / transcript=MONOS_14275.1 / gene=MONOS_14275 / organism=Monocercomonoides_exilis_PA203 / gene_product=unspecified product / transcript_product=unspecified product / location=Mono_scaffold00969:10672-11085(-) / protein_length=138 / sequence_SO=supercontig / SO=protein_coding / is_pseudo=false